MLIRAAYRGHRWFDRVVLIAPLIGIAGAGASPGTGLLVRVLRLAGFGTMYVPGAAGEVLETRPFAGNIVTSDPVRYARNAAVLEAEPALGIGRPTVAWVDAAFRATYAMRERRYASRIRQPMLIVSAGQDMVVSDAAIEEFAEPAPLRLAPGGGRRQARAVDGAGSLPRPVLGGVRRFRPRNAGVLGPRLIYVTAFNAA